MGSGIGGDNPYLNFKYHPIANRKTRAIIWYWTILDSYINLNAHFLQTLLLYNNNDIFIYWLWAERKEKKSQIWKNENGNKKKQKKVNDLEIERNVQLCVSPYFAVKILSRKTVLAGERDSSANLRVHNQCQQKVKFELFWAKIWMSFRPILQNFRKFWFRKFEKFNNRFLSVYRFSIVFEKN